MCVFEAADVDPLVEFEGRCDWFADHHVFAAENQAHVEVVVGDGAVLYSVIATRLGRGRCACGGRRGRFVGYNFYFMRAATKFFAAFEARFALWEGEGAGGLWHEDVGIRVLRGGGALAVDEGDACTSTRLWAPH